MSRRDVVVIGAGPNGLAAGGLLARAGRDVLVLERADAIGGVAAGREFHPGYRTAGLLQDTTGLRPEVVEELSLERHGLVRTDGPPPVLAASPDGRGILLHHDPEAARGEIAALSSRDADRYAGYREFLARVASFAVPFLSEAPPDPADTGPAALLALASKGWKLRRLGRADMLEVLRLAPMCVADWLREWFETEALCAALAGPALSGSFLGPWSPGSNANLVRREVLAGRAVVGGPAALVEALEKCARSEGADLRTGAVVSRIAVGSDGVEGVTLGDGERIEAELVLATCDPKRTFLELVENPGPGLERKISQYRCAGTTAHVNLALNAPLRFRDRDDDVTYARTGATLDDLERAFDAIKYARFSGERRVTGSREEAAPPWLEIHVPTVERPELAPAGHAVASILVHYAPYDLAGGWTDARRDELGDAVVEELARHAPGLGDAIVAREVSAPPDLEVRHALTGGHVLHGEHQLDQLLVRPVPECARYSTPVPGLFLGGSGSHPGGGVTAGPGALAARAVLGAPRRAVRATSP